MKLARLMGQAGIVASAILVAAASLAVGAPNASASSMEVGSITSQPIGHFELCKRHPIECAVRRNDTMPVAFTSETMSLVQNVNLAVNRSVEPFSDMEIYGRQEWWAYPEEAGQRGDCEDFALEKRRMLMHRGIAAGNLLLTVVRKPDGEGHAVLTVRTDRGDYILDNLSDAVMAWQDTGYHFLKRQAENHSGRWKTIRGGSTSPLVSAVRSTTR